MPVSAQNVKELQRQQQELQEQLAETAKMLKQTKKDETATENKLNLLNNDIKTRKKLIRNIQGEINALNGEMGTLRQKRTDLQKQLEACKEDYARLVRETHYADMQQSPLLFLLSADNFQQLVRRIQYMQQFAAYRKEQVKKIESLQTEIDIQNNLLNQRKNDRSTALQSQKREQDKLTRDERKQKDMLKSLKTQEKNLLAKQKEQQKKVDALNKQIEEMIGISDTFHQFVCITVSARGRGEPFLAAHAVAAQSHDIVDTQKCKIVKSAFDLLLRIASADQMRHNFYIISGHDRSAHSGLADTVAYKVAAECSVNFLAILELVPVTGYIYVFRTELHERSNALQKFILCYASEWRYNLN